MNSNNSDSENYTSDSEYELDSSDVIYTTDSTSDNGEPDNSDGINTNNNNKNRKQTKETYLRCQFYNINECGYCKVTWDLALKDSSIKSIQEPISEMMVGKIEFDEAYNQFMVTLDGRDITSFVDFFWRRSEVDTSCLEFIDKDTRMDIYDYFRDGDLVPDMEKVHSGDWKFKR